MKIESTAHHYNRTRFLAIECLKNDMFSSVRQHISAAQPFALITASRHNKTVAENDDVNIRLVAHLKSLGLSATLLRFQSRGGAQNALFVPHSVSLPTVMQLMSEYKQSGAVISDGIDVSLIDAVGAIERNIGSGVVTVTALKDLWSDARGCEFHSIESGFVTGNSLDHWAYAMAGLSSDLTRAKDFFNGYKNGAMVCAEKSLPGQGAFFANT